MKARIDRRVSELVALFATIARTRMAGVPILHPALEVEALGFELTPGEGDEAPGEAVGILVTPWFMNLVRLPLARDESGAAVGRAQRHRVGAQCFEFIGAHEPALGAFSACSLFSPMFEFADQAAARATARAVLDELRREPLPARRSFLFGRSAGEASR